MSGIPWKDIFEVVRFALWIALGINGLHLVRVLIVEVFGKVCPHCKRKI